MLEFHTHALLCDLSAFGPGGSAGVRVVLYGLASEANPSGGSYEGFSVLGISWGEVAVPSYGHALAVAKNFVYSLPENNMLKTSQN